MSNYSRGRAAEYRAKVALERAGYCVVRAAGSKGPADLVAFDNVSIRLISVKVNCYASAGEREQLQLLPAPQNASREIWRYASGCSWPVIERL